MPQTTAKYGLHYPEGADPADPPTDFLVQNMTIEDALDGIGMRGFRAFSLDTAQSFANSAYTFMGTPDRIDDVVFPVDNCLALIGYRALVKATGADFAGKAALFFDSTQVKIAQSGAADTAGVQSNDFGATNMKYAPLTTKSDMAITSGAWGMETSIPSGADSTLSSSPRMLSPGTATGGGFVIVEVPLAGTYDIGVKFKASTGSVFAKERRLWVGILAPAS